MRFFEFENSDTGLDKFVTILRNFIGRAASKKAPARLNWASLQNIAQQSGFELGADYETFKQIYDTTPSIQNLVKDFNADGIELAVPGLPDEGPDASGAQDSQDSQAALDQAAASAAPAITAQSQATPPAPALS